jgi:hypothetical protein
MDDTEETPRYDSRSALRWHLVWFCVFMANLPLPVLAGYELGREARAGMALGVIIWLLLSHLVFHEDESLRGVMVCGGICVALSQVAVVIHLFAGILAAYIATIVFDVQGGSVAAGFWLTVFTGGELMAASLVCGWPLWSLVRFCQEAS